MQDTQIEELMVRFERAKADDFSALIESFIDGNQKKNVPALAELIRCEIELAADAGIQLTSIEQYLNRFPILNDAITELAQIAFEEFRTRRRLGESVQPSLYADQYEIDVSEWPLLEEDSDSAVPGWTRAAGQFPEIGDEIIEFRIVGEIGRGAYGRVFLATQGSLSGRLVVLKITIGESPEALFLAELQHTNIMPIFSVHQVGDWQVICMPFLGLATLRDLLAATKQSSSIQKSGQALISTIADRKITELRSDLNDLPGGKALKLRFEKRPRSEFGQLAGRDRVNMALWLARNIASGLAHAHSLGIIHGDIKPANILIADDGTPLLLDFHLASTKLAEPPEGGTLPYMAPEHLLALVQNNSIDARSDLYSLGIVIIEILHGQVPSRLCSQKETANWDQWIQELAEKRFQDRSIESTLKSLTISSDARAIIRKCIASNADERYDSADQLIVDLDRHFDNLPPVHAGSFSVRERFQKWSRRHPKLTSASAIGSALATVIVFIALFFYWTLENNARYRAEAQSREFLSELDSVRGTLNIINDSTENVSASIQLAQELLDQNGAGSPEMLAKETRFRRLDTRQQMAESDAVAATCFWIAHANLRNQYLNPDSSSNLAAARVFNQAGLDFVPDSTSLLNQRALIEERDGQTDLADHYRKQAESHAGIGRKEQLRMAANLTLQGKRTLAVEKLRQHVAIQPDDFSAWLALGNVHSAQGEHSAAENCYTICIYLAPHVPRGYLYRSLSRLGLDKNEEALMDLGRAEYYNGDGFTIQFNRAIALRNTKRLNEAEHALNRALEIRPESTRAIYSRALIRAQIGKSKLSHADLERCTGSKPSGHLDWISMGMAHLQLLENDQALRAFEQAIRCRPDSIIALQNLASLYSEILHQPQEAVRLMDRLIELDEKGRAKQTATRGVLYARLGNREAALRDANQALAISDNADIHYRVAGIYALTAKREPDDRDLAVRHLAISLWNSVKSYPSRIENDRDLIDLNGKPDFEKLLRWLTHLQTQSENQINKD